MAVIDNLRVSKEAMETAINTYETKKTALENAYLKISNEVRVLDGTWHGAASEKFKGQFEQLYKNLQQNETVMGNVIAKLKEAMAVYEEQEQVVAQAGQAMETGTAYQPNL